MFKVYWTETGTAKSEDFETEQLREMLKFIESLRVRQHTGEDISFITSANENPNSVGKQGVDEVGPDYDWTKRRVVRCIPIE